MTTDITELAQSHELRNKVNHRLYGALEFQGTSGEHATVTLSIDECKSIIAAMDERLALVEALEKSEKTSEARREAIDITHKRAARERDRANAAEEALEKAQTINAAAEKLVRCKGRYHSEQNYRALAVLFGVTILGLPPIDGESRTVKLPKPISVLYRREFTEAHCAIYAYPEAEVNAALDDAGIKWEAE